MFIATLIAAERLAAGDLSAAADRLREAGCAPGEAAWIDEGAAADLRFDRDATRARVAIEGAIAGVDVVVQPRAGREKRLLVADMDSTMITVECIDELADYAGVKAEVAEVTEAAMRGELDFEGALDARVALLAGLDEAAVDRCLAERVRITSGAETLVRTMRARGATCVLVSGGFTRFAEPVAAAIGFDRAIANVLLAADGSLTGRVARPIVDAATKEATLRGEAARLGLGHEETLAVGDGANDLPMIAAAGLGVAEDTVDQRLRGARRHLGVGSSMEAARLLAEHEGGGHAAPATAMPPAASVPPPAPSPSPVYPASDVPPASGDAPSLPDRGGEGVDTWRWPLPRWNGEENTLGAGQRLFWVFAIMVASILSLMLALTMAESLTRLVRMLR